MRIESLKNLKIPDKSGVYFFRKGRTILYIGKATSLRSRVKSYFGVDLIHTRGPILVDLVFQADSISWQETDTVLEALILEANMIKRYQPRYNTKEKSDKSFNYVCITNEELPKVIIVRGRELSQKRNSFGPFTNSLQLKEALKIIRPIFPFLDNYSKNGHEFYRQIGLAPDVSEKEKIKLYKNNIENIKLFFQGKKKEILRNLKKEMNLYAKNRAFERANIVKIQIFALEHINDVALLKKENIRNSSVDFTMRIEAYDVAHMAGKNMVGVMTVVENGEAIKNEYKKFRIRTQEDANDTGALKEILERRFNHPEWKHPVLMVVDGGTAQINASKNVLKVLELDIPVVSVLKDERHKPKSVLGDTQFIRGYKSDVLLANSEAHRFAISYHKNIRGRNFLPGFKRKK